METDSTISSQKSKGRRKTWRSNCEKIMNINLENSGGVGLGDWPEKTSNDSKDSSRNGSRYSKNSSRGSGSTSWESYGSTISTRLVWKNGDPKLILVAACDNCAIMDLDAGGPPYHGLDYQVSFNSIDRLRNKVQAYKRLHYDMAVTVKLQLLPILEKKQGLQFRKVRRCHVLNQGSWLEIECGNELTYNWLKDVANVPFTSNQGVYIRFYPANIRYKYVIVRVPIVEGSNDKFCMELFRQRCRKQNPPLNTWHWRLIDRKKVHEGEEGNPFDQARILLLEVPDETIEYLDIHYWNLFYQLGKICFEPAILDDEGSIESSFKIKCCKDSICKGPVCFTKESFRNKSLLPICPVVQYLHKLEMEEVISENSEEQVIGVTNISIHSDATNESTSSSV